MRLSLISLKSKWQLYIALLALIAIGIYLIMLAFDIPMLNIPLLFVIVIGGIPVFLQILFKLFKGNLGADLLAAIALVTGVILHQYLAATLIILMLASGQTLEYYAMRKASSVLRSLVARMPSIAHRKINSHIEDIPLLDIKVDDLIVIYPHETCPVDGIVIEGHGSMDESYLTGEPYQISKTPGAFVLSGAINGETLLIIKTTKLTSDSRYCAIVKVLEEAEQKRPSIRRLGDQIGAIFAPIALVFAIAAWYFTGDAIRFLSVLVIATPCPLLIAIPITIISAISRAARQSIVIKDPTVLEQLPTCKTAIFDKTGTLTYGKPALTEISVVPGYTKEMVLKYVASLERYSKHPLSNAVLNAAQKENITLLESSNVSEKPGQGLRGIIGNHTILITSRKKILEVSPEGIHLLPPVAPGLECIVLIDNQYAASLHFHDAPRIESKSFLGHLAPSHQFKKIMLVSGDRESEVVYLANLLNIKEIRASQSPEQKLAIVREEIKRAPTVFMGDGINDAPALTAATVGIAFGQYSNVTAEAAGAVIMENTLCKVDELIHLSLNTRRIASQSAIGGMLLSIIGMGVAAGGFINPVSGAIIQELIDILAIVNALRLAFGSRINIDLPEFSK
ncbi:heavy metal translocating P-type ATPase [Legionella longbeachae]|uniref:P-type Zn(2+) transporter n=1 Tax=Legionella longbeachae serogroup 1 (strain NSW150) TaxID=661367 RepID=D3HLU3_LEGLN|nr:heavy metal translocating P-type ATPase [Legionella longbeachae]VEE03854.1 cation transport ATPase [Legionella oakridgensis]HBD7397364.1 heavy metal translocating P-type ATPase [Legionella pneumophila]ARB93286.1 heavy metal translocating P-type ATPase [Legionella longbeachae]ARM33650.1 heavy metal translocating P-type ATPase [Legionella longbeachae]EEZ93512.1 heavy metal translocating P-type ATPase [Legionella longbeachae D-4968]